MLDGCVSWGCLLHCLARRINCPDIETLHDGLSMPDYTDLSCSGGCADDRLLNRKGMFSVSPSRTVSCLVYMSYDMYRYPFIICIVTTITIIWCYCCCFYQCCCQCLLMRLISYGYSSRKPSLYLSLPVL